MLNHQVKTSFLLRPHGKTKGELRKDGKSKDASSTDGEDSSDEDFAFLEEKLKRNELDEIETRLLQGIIQKPPRMRKRFDHMTRDEYRKNKKGENYSDEYDDEDAGSWDDESDYEKHGGGNKVANSSSITTDGKKKGEKDKDGNLKRPDNISEKEWKRMNREQQMERMNKMAHGFHFYQMDGKNEQTKYKMPF